MSRKHAGPYYRRAEKLLNHAAATPSVVVGGASHPWRLHGLRRSRLRRGTCQISSTVVIQLRLSALKTNTPSLRNVAGRATVRDRGFLTLFGMEWLGGIEAVPGVPDATRPCSHPALTRAVVRICVSGGFGAAFVETITNPSKCALVYQ